jgi:hypothetical protein
MSVSNSTESPKNKPTQSSFKERLFNEILESLKAQGQYFTHRAVKNAATVAGVEIKDKVLNVYLHQAVKQGIIHDAGRGWYSRLSEPVKLDLQPVAKLVKAVEKAFPLLDFTVWSTAQINPWMHHLLAKPVTFLHVPRETLETVGETLRALGWDVAINPGKREVAKAIRPGEKMVVLRPAHSKQPPTQSRQAAVEQVLVEMLLEADCLGIMDSDEAKAVFVKIASGGRLEIPVIQRFADSKRLNLPALESIN